MHFHGSAAAMSLIPLVLFLFLTLGNSFPVTGSSWLDKLPSFEVKVKTDGITVRTGPSREDIYEIVGYILLGLVSVVLLAVGVTICVYKCCYSRRSSPPPIAIHPSIHGVQPSQIGFPNFNLQHNPHNGSYIRPITNTSFCGDSIVSTHAWPSNGTMENLEMKTNKNSCAKPVTSRIYRSTS